MKNKEELLIKQAKEGYTVCYIDQCPLHNQCLRWLVGQHMPQTASTYRCVNPHFEGVATADCPMYRNDQKVRFAKGMMNIFTNDMPKRALTILSIATVHVSFRLPCNRLSVTCSALTDGRKK